jgi:soluble lytic murein transglycosylase
MNQQNSQHSPCCFHLKTNFRRLEMRIKSNPIDSSVARLLEFLHSEGHNREFNMQKSKVLPESLFLPLHSLMLGFLLQSSATRTLHPTEIVTHRLIQKEELLGKAALFQFKSAAISDSEIQLYVEREFNTYLPKKFKKRSAIIAKTLLNESAKHHLDPLFLLSVIKVESRFNPNARGRHTEIGLMQIKPDTGAWIFQKLNLKWPGDSSLKDPEFNIAVGAAYFSYLRNRFKQKASFYVSAYNAGENRVRILQKRGSPPKVYTKKITKKYSENYQRLLASASP